MMWQMLLMLSLLGYQRGEIKEEQRVDFVLLDVAAFRGKGQPVTDLKASDFEVRENKKEVDVTFFDILDYRQAFELGLVDSVPTRSGTEKGGEVPRPKPLQQITLVLDFELYHIEEVLGAFDHLMTFFEELDPAYRYQIMVYTMDKGMLTEGFSDDLGEVRRVIEHYRAQFRGYREKGPTWDQDDPLGAGPPTDRPNQWVESGSYRNKNGVVTREGNLRHWAREFNAYYYEARLIQCLRNFSRGGGNNPCACLDDELDDFLNIIALRTEGIIERLVDLTYKFDGTTQLKSMYFVSPGFVLEDVSAIHDIHRKYQIQAECGKPNYTARTGTDLDRYRDETPRQHHLELRSDFREVVHACVRNRVMFNTVHFYKGTYRGDLQSEFIKRNGHGLLELAEKSGGRFHQTGDLRTVLSQDFDQNRYFYVLGYKSQKGRKGKYRRITVKCKRRGVKLRYRDGYYIK